VDLVFCGTPPFAVPTLEALARAGHQIKLVVTQPDRPAGRGLQTVESPVKQLAQQLGLAVAQPEKIKNNPEFRAQLEALRPQAIVVVAYGRIIPQWMIDLPPLGNINLHASLLPKYRGAAPIQWAIANGERLTGVTTMRIDAGLDTGDMLLRHEEPMAPGETTLTLAPRLARIGAELMLKTLRGLETGTIQPRPQDDSQATLAPLLKKEDGEVDFSRTAQQIYNRFRAFQPWPGAYTHFRGQLLKLLELRPAAPSVNLAPSELAFQGDCLFAGAAGPSAVELLKLQFENRKPVTAQQFAHGVRLAGGERLGN
jgi:methionyl-tRNA formyltransferase